MYRNVDALPTSKVKFLRETARKEFLREQKEKGKPDKKTIKVLCVCDKIIKERENPQLRFFSSYLPSRYYLEALSKKKNYDIVVSKEWNYKSRNFIVRKITATKSNEKFLLFIDSKF